MSELHGFKVHPAAEVFPLVTGHEFDDLVESIKERGLLDPIVYVTGSDASEQVIIDGRNRLRACIAAGVKPSLTRYQGRDVATYVVDKNLRRRHLDESQRAMIAARLASAPLGGPGSRSTRVPIGTLAQPLVSLDDAAKKLKVGRTSAARAKRVITSGTPELIAAVDSGDLAVAAAEKIANMPKAEQVAAVAVATGKQTNTGDRDMMALKQRALGLLSSGMRIEDAASALGLRANTIHKWRSNPDAVPRGPSGGASRSLVDADVQRLHNEGMSVTEIASELRVANSTVTAYLKRLGLGKAGKRAQNLLGEHISRAEASAETWRIGAETIMAAASVSSEDHIQELIAALGALSSAATALKTRLNKEVGKKKENEDG